MPSRYGTSLLLAVILVSSASGSPALAQEKPPGPAQGTPQARVMPSLFPLYPSPPIPFRGNRVFSVVFTTTPGIIREFVPEPLVPNAANVMFVYIGSLNIESPLVGRFNYLEAGIGIPVTFPETNTAGNYALCLYLDKAMPIVGGREIWGFPKKDAEIAFIERNGDISGQVERGGTVLLRISGAKVKKADPVPNPSQTPWFLQKIIPAAEKNAPPDVWQLVSSSNIDHLTRELWNCTAKLEISSGPQDPLGDIKIIKILSSQFSVDDFAMDYGKVLYDYRARK